MSKRLVFLLVPVIVLAVVYALVMRAWLLKQESESEVNSAAAEATAAFVEETLAESEDFDLDEAPIVVATVSPELELMEYAGRRIEVNGKITTLDEKRQFLQAVEADLTGSFTVDDRIMLDYQCSAFSWLEALETLDFGVIQEIRRFRMRLTNTEVRLNGVVSREAEVADLEQRIRRGLPRGVTLESELQVAPAPLAALSVWSAPDSTVLLSGRLPEGEENAYLDIVKTSVPGARIVSDVITDRFVRPPSWQGRIKTFLPEFLQTVQRTSFTIANGDEVQIAGLAQASTIAGLRRRVAESFPSPPFQLDLDLQLGVPRALVNKPEATGTAPPSSGGNSQPAQTLTEMVESMKILFPRGRSRVSQLAQEERDKLDRFAEQWKREAFSGKVFVFGFTDASGDAATNAYFSKTRCSNVVGYLRRKHDLDSSAFEIVGTPEDHPPETGPADQLRRVEFGFAEEPSQQPVLNWSAERGAPNQLLKPVKAEELFSNLGEITFGKGKITPAYDFRQKLRQYGAAMVLEKRDDVIVIYGFSDNKGSAQSNRWYTEERCKAVANELIKVGYPEDQIVLRPVLPAKTTGGEDGEDPEADDGEEEEEETVNPRRVRLVVMSQEAFQKAEGATQGNEADTQEVPDAGEVSGEASESEVPQSDVPGEASESEVPESEVPESDVPSGVTPLSAS